MQAEPRRPFSVALCNAIVRVAALFLPAAQQEAWKQEWFAEIWHRWQFLFHAGAWNRWEALRLIRNCLGAFPDAAWQFASQETVQTRIREWARSPWMCLGVLSCALFLVGIFTSGFPATRQLFFPHLASDRDSLLFVWLHPVIGGGDRGFPPDVAPAWAKHSRLLEGVAPFRVSRAGFSVPGLSATAKPLIVDTEPGLFQVLQVRPAQGKVPSTGGVVIDHAAWTSLFRGNPHVLGTTVKVGNESYRLSAILPATFHLLSRQPSVYVVKRAITDPRVMILARVKPGVSRIKLDRELTKISEDVCYYFFNSQLRFAFLQSMLLTPLRFFGVAVVVGALMSLVVFRVRVGALRSAWKPEARGATTRRVLFFSAKTLLALSLVFTAGLEWSRSQSSVLFGSSDPGSGPFLVWLFILGAMGVFFWSLADQRARCRVCLRLMCFPVRVGCPGCVFLNWSGTELLCTEGHGILHVPHLAPSWDEESDHWISLDESWRDLFVENK